MDNYIHEMDWATSENLFDSNSNYRMYQYDLIRDYVGKNILEVGTGDREFTHLLVTENHEVERIYSTEPSDVFFKDPSSKFQFPTYVQFENKDLFNLKDENLGQFDTIVFIHVLEHIEQDKMALDVSYDLLEKDGHILIEVPALPFLFSKHDESLGHYRRYTKKMLRSIVDTNKFEILKLWYQDPIGVLGSFYYFKVRKIKLKSDAGENLVSTQGNIYDKYVIPFEKKLEKLITFPFGLSLTAILKKK